MSIERDRPYGRVNYLVSLGDVDDGSPAAGFSEVTGLGLEIEYVDYRSGNEKVNTPRKLPGLHRVGDITLRRGVIGSTDLFDWLSRVSRGEYEPRNVTITLLDESGEAVVTWLVRRAQPKSWTGPTLDADGSDEVAIEELVLVAEGLSME